MQFSDNSWVLIGSIDFSIRIFGGSSLESAVKQSSALLKGNAFFPSSSLATFISLVALVTRK